MGVVLLGKWIFHRVHGYFLGEFIHEKAQGPAASTLHLAIILFIKSVQSRQPHEYDPGFAICAAISLETQDSNLGNKSAI